MKRPKKDVYEIITERITDLLEKGTIPWRRPWAGGEMPRNLVSKKPYNGINVLMLACAGFTSPYFLTFNQTRKLGGTVKKGEKGTPVIFWKLLKDKKGAVTKNGKEKTFGFLRYYSVFNAAQCDGIEVPAPVVPAKDFDPIKAAEDIEINYEDCPTITHKGGRACYSPGGDQIMMPSKDSFVGAAEYYSTLFHEMGHSTGHKKRLDREGVTDPIKFGSHKYSKEELVAEFTACFLCAEAGINNTLDNSAAYIQNWLKALKDDPKMIVQASGKATRAAKYITGTLDPVPAPKAVAAAV